MNIKFIKAIVGCALVSLTLCACNGGNVGNENDGMIDENGLIQTEYGDNTGNGILGTDFDTNNTNSTNGLTNGTNSMTGNTNNAPSFTDNQNSSNILNMNDIWNDIISKSGDNLPAKNVDDTYLEDTYGIKKEDVEDYRLFVIDDNTKSDEIFIAKVSKNKMDDVTDAIKNRQQVLETKWRDEDKDEYGKVSDYKLLKNGDYVLFVISDKVDDINKIFNEYTDK